MYIYIYVIQQYLFICNKNKNYINFEDSFKTINIERKINVYVPVFTSYLWTCRYTFNEWKTHGVSNPIKYIQSLGQGWFIDHIHKKWLK